MMLDSVLFTTKRGQGSRPLSMQAAASRSDSPAGSRVSVTGAEGPRCRQVDVKAEVGRIGRDDGRQAEARTQQARIADQIGVGGGRKELSIVGVDTAQHITLPAMGVQTKAASTKQGRSKVFSSSTLRGRDAASPGSGLGSADPKASATFAPSARWAAHRSGLGGGPC